MAVGVLRYVTLWLLVDFIGVWAFESGVVRELLLMVLLMLFVVMFVVVMFVVVMFVVVVFIDEEVVAINEFKTFDVSCCEVDFFVSGGGATGLAGSEFGVGVIVGVVVGVVVVVDIVGVVVDIVGVVVDIVGVVVDAFEFKSALT